MMLKNLKHLLGKDKFQYVTIEEFADYSGISIELIRKI